MKVATRIPNSDNGYICPHCGKANYLSKSIIVDTCPSCREMYRTEEKKCQKELGVMT